MVSKLWLLIGFLSFGIFPHRVYAQTSTDWYMAGANPQRTSWVSTNVSGVTGIDWYRPIESYIDQKTQIITANRKIYVNTAKGLIVLDAETGDLKWRFDTEMPLSHSPTVIGDVVYVAGLDHAVYALRDQDSSYQLLWRNTNATAGYSTSPLVVNNIVYIGNRDGNLYAFRTSDGSPAWSSPFRTGGAIMYSAAYANNTVFFASNDMYAYAVRADSGTQVWKSSQKLPGERYQSWWPVVFDKYVIFTASTGYKNTARPGTQSVDGQTNYNALENRDFWGGSASSTTLSGTTLTSDGSQGWPSGTYILDSQSNSTGPMSLSAYLQQYPHRRTVIALDAANGQETIRPPFHYAGTSTGNRYPPVVNPNDQAMYLINTYRFSSISRVMVMGWKPTSSYLRLIRRSATSNSPEYAIDEPAALSGFGSDFLYNLCCDRSAASLIRNQSFWSYPSTLEGVLPADDSNPQEYDPMWRIFRNELERLHNYYTGTLTTINGVYGSHGLQNPLVPYSFTNASGQNVQRIFTHRSNTIIAVGQNGSKRFLSAIPAAAPKQTGNVISRSTAISRLEQEVEKMMVSYESDPQHRFLNPGYYNHGLHPTDFAAHYFENPGETLATLSRAYMLITNTSLRSRLSTYLQAYYQKYFGSAYITNTGWNEGLPREDMAYPPEVSASFSDSRLAKKSETPYTQYNLYAVWKYAQAFPSQALTVYNRFRSSVSTSLPGCCNYASIEAWQNDQPYTVNSYIAGYYGFLNLQSLAYNNQIPSGEQTIRQQVQNALNQLLSVRANRFSKDHQIYGQLDNPTATDTRNSRRVLNVSRNFIYLVPELGDYLSKNNAATIRDAIDEYMYLAPQWFVSATDNGFGESTQSVLHNSRALFSARAWILKEPAETLFKYVDTPVFARGDLIYMDNLITALEAPSQGGQDPTPPPKPGDANGDTRVDGIDYMVWRSHYNQNVSGSQNGDFDNSGKVDGIDYMIWRSNYNK